MREFTVTIKGKTQGDIDQSIDETTRLIKDGCVSGRDENTTGSFVFDSKGELEDDDEDGEA